MPNHLPELSSILELASGRPTELICQTPTHVDKQPVVVSIRFLKKHKWDSTHRLHSKSASKGKLRIRIKYKRI